MYKYKCDTLQITRINSVVNQICHLGKFNYFFLQKGHYFFVVHVDYNSLWTKIIFSYTLVWHLAHFGQDSTMNKNNNCPTFFKVLHNVKQYQL